MWGRKEKGKKKKGAISGRIVSTRNKKKEGGETAIMELV